jgi:hypothetical protein
VEQRPEQDIDQLILELHASAAADPSGAAPGSTARLERWLHVLAEKHGSDLLLVAGAPPCVRIDGKVIPLAEGPLDGLDIEEAMVPPCRRTRGVSTGTRTSRTPRLGWPRSAASASISIASADGRRQPFDCSRPACHGCRL